MLKTLLFVVIIATVQCLEVGDEANGNSNIQTQPAAHQVQNDDGFSQRSDWSYYYPSWSLPSMSHLFKDDDDAESTDLLKRLANVEKMVKELKDLLKKQSTGSKKPESTTTPRNKVEAPPCKESPPKSTVDKEPEKDADKKPAKTNKPSQPEKGTDTSEKVDKPKEPTKTPESSEKPDKNTEKAQDEDPSKESSPPANDEVAAPSKEE